MSLVTTDTDLALARSVLYRGLTLGFSLPSEASLAQLASAEARAALEQAAALLDSCRVAAEPLGPGIRAFGSTPAGGLPVLRRSYARLFGHSHGLVPPFETEYGGEVSFRQPQELADIAGYYLAFGLKPAAGVDERADHVACECEFMDFLARKEALVAASARDSAAGAEAGEQREIICEAARGFLRDHLGHFGRTFAVRVAKADAGGFFGALGGVMLRLLGLECERFGVPPGPATLELRPPAPEPAPMACGSCVGGEPLIQPRPRP